MQPYELTRWNQRPARARDEMYLRNLNRFGDFMGWGGTGTLMYHGGKLIKHALSNSATKRPTSGDQGPPAKRLRGSDIKEVQLNDRGDIVPNIRSSVSNSPPTANMEGSTNSGSGNNQGLVETPVDKVIDVERGPPEYVFASLPFFKDFKASNSGIGRDFTFRMTSPYDPNVGDATSTDLNAGAGTAIHNGTHVLDSADTAITSARWFDYYSTAYDYYHVVAARYHIAFENLTNEPMWVHMMYCNDEYPPEGASNEDILTWRDARSHLVGQHALPIATGALEHNHQVLGNNVEGSGAAPSTANYETSNHTVSRGASPLLNISGEYRPGQFKRQIHLDSEIENWTAVNANPQLPERLVMRVKPYHNGIDTNDGTVYGSRTLIYRFTLKIEYLVEFKQLKTGLRWPVERQPLTRVIVTNIEEDEE